MNRSGRHTTFTAVVCTPLSRAINLYIHSTIYIDRIISYIQKRLASCSHAKYGPVMEIQNVL
jgi:hypothetical protein